MRDKTRSLAEGKWHHILPMFGVDPEHLRNKPGPCPICGGKDRFRYDDKGLGLWFCQQCRAGDGFSMVMALTGMDFAEAAFEIEKALGKEPVGRKDQPAKKDPMIRLKKVSAMIEPAQGRATEHYLRARFLEPAPATRHVPSLEYYDDGKMAVKTPAMVHSVRAPDGSPATLHVTYLDGAGKALVNSPKKMLPPCKDWKGGAIRLYPVAGDVIGIAEGIETAMACHQFSGLPVWAAVTADNLAEFVPPDGIREVIIFGDNDESLTGHAVSYALARKLKAKKYEVSVAIPEEIGDWADRWEANHAS